MQRSEATTPPRTDSSGPTASGPTASGSASTGLIADQAPGEPSSTAPPRTQGWRRYEWASAIPFALVHVAVLGALFTGVSWQAAVVCAVLYFVRIFAVTGVYHRYFAHRTYKTSRPFQFALAWLAQTSAQKGVLWWAAHHRAHHLFSDDPRDLHSPKQSGFLHSHMGWIFDDTTETDWKRIKDFSKYPELVWLNKYWVVPRW